MVALLDLTYSGASRPAPEGIYDPPLRLHGLAGFTSPSFSNEARRAGIPEKLLRAIVDVESSGNPRAYRYEPAFFGRYIQGKAPWTGMPWYSNPRRISASYGLGQLMYTTAYERGYRGAPEGLYDAALNLRLTAAHLAHLWRRHGGRWVDVAAAYNSGQPYKKAPAYTRGTYIPRVAKRLGTTAGGPSRLPAAVLGGVPVVALAGAGAVALGLLWMARRG